MSETALSHILLSPCSPSNPTNATLFSAATASGHVCSRSIALALRMLCSTRLCFPYNSSPPRPGNRVMLAMAARESIRHHKRVACSAGSVIARRSNPSVSELTASMRRSRISLLMRPGRSTRLRYMYAIIRALVDPVSCCCPRVFLEKLAGPRFGLADLLLSTHHHASVGCGDRPMNSTQRKVHWSTLEDSSSCISLLMTQPIALVAQLQSALRMLLDIYRSFTHIPKNFCNTVNSAVTVGPQWWFAAVTSPFRCMIIAERASGFVC